MNSLATAAAPQAMPRPPRLSPELFAACGYFLPRLLFLQARHAPSVHWGDIVWALEGFPLDNLDLASPQFWDEWRLRWSARAAHHQERASRAGSVAGRSRALRAAAASWHWAEFMDFEDRARKLHLRGLVRACFEASLQGSTLRRTHHRLALPGIASLPYWVLLPEGDTTRGPLPAVVMSNGLDSMTEVEVLALAEPLLERRMAVVLFEGPGQGLDVGQRPLKLDMETVVQALLDTLRADPRLDSSRMGFMGVSFGGYIALRVAEHMGARWRGVVNFSGGPRMAPFEGLPRRLKEDFRFALGGGAAGDMQTRFDAMALQGGTRLRTDVLSIHGALDDIFPLQDLQALHARWHARHTLVVQPREAHVCLLQVDECSHLAADWLAARLLRPGAVQPVQAVPQPLQDASRDLAFANNNPAGALP